MISVTTKTVAKEMQLVVETRTKRSQKSNKNILLKQLTNNKYSTSTCTHMLSR